MSQNYPQCISYEVVFRSVLSKKFVSALWCLSSEECDKCSDAGAGHLSFTGGLSVLSSSWVAPKVVKPSLIFLDSLSPPGDIVYFNRLFVSSFKS